MEMTTTEARNQFSEIINQAAYGKEPVVLTRRGKPLVAVVPVEALKILEEWEDEQDAKELDEAYADWERRGKPTVSLDEALARSGLARADLEE